MRHDSGKGNELDVRKWEKVIDQEVRRVGLNKWRNEMERKDTLELYKEKGTPGYERWMMEAWVVTFSFEPEHSVWM